jgi:F0F1-type ATP synthase assembly protein I
VNDDQINQTALLAGIVGQIGCITVIIIAVALGAGIFLDRFLDTRPIFTILFLVGSVPITLFVTVRVSLMAAARARKLGTAETKKEAEEKA